MFSYIVPALALLLVFSNPIIRLFTPAPDRAALMERPALNESLLAIPGPGDGVGCRGGGYAVHVWSAEPLVIYVEGFISGDERRDILEVSEPIFEPSTITHNGGVSHRSSAVHDSLVAFIPRTASVRCVEERARSLQGWRDEVWVERLRTQKYLPGGHYAPHFDWSGNPGGWDRVSSAMAWVRASEDLEGGGTEFPLLPARRGPAVEEGVSGRDPWCQFVECEDGRVKTGDDGLGVTFKPVEGNAVFWTNFRADGSGEGYRETWHAGLPVTKGEKVGLNIWSWGRI